MKLLFDQNLSYKLPKEFEDAFPDSIHASSIRPVTIEDRRIWSYARDHGFTIITHDTDFAELLSMYGPPPKVVLFRCGNQTNRVIKRLILSHLEEIKSMETQEEPSCLEISAVSLY